MAALKASSPRSPQPALNRRHPRENTAGRQLGALQNQVRPSGKDLALDRAAVPGEFHIPSGSRVSLSPDPRPAAAPSIPAAAPGPGLGPARTTARTPAPGSRPIHCRPSPGVATGAGAWLPAASSENSYRTRPHRHRLRSVDAQSPPVSGVSAFAMQGASGGVRVFSLCRIPALAGW
jgi:hypothetical protein